MPSVSFSASHLRSSDCGSVLPRFATCRSPFFFWPTLAQDIRSSRISKKADSKIRVEHTRSEIGTCLSALALAVWVIQGGFYRSLASNDDFGIGLTQESNPGGFAEYLRKAGGFTGKIFNDPQDGGLSRVPFSRAKALWGFAVHGRARGRGAILSGLAGSGSAVEPGSDPDLRRFSVSRLPQRLN